MTKMNGSKAGDPRGGNDPKTIAIIGGGFSGVMVASQLLRMAKGPIQIKLIERSTSIGRGVAFGTRYSIHMLNVPASEMSAFPSDPDHFLQKTVEEGRHVGIDKDSFVPRKIYGQYIEHVLAESIGEAHPDVSFDRIAEEAVGIDVTSDDWAHIKFNSGLGLIADKVVLAVGNLPPGDPPIGDNHFYRSHRYFSHPWSESALRWLFPDEAVMLLGSGLTCIDVITALREQGHKGLIHVVSRRGLLPHVHKTVEADPPFLTGDDAKLGIRILMRRIRARAKQAMAEGRDWRAVFDSLRPVTQELWLRLSPAEKRRFLRHVRPYWEIYRHRSAPAPFQMVADLMAAGQVVLHGGRVLNYSETRHWVDVQIDRRMKAGTGHLRVSRVINCTGPLSDYRKLTHPLMRDLMAQGAIQPDDLNMGLSVLPDGSLIGFDSKPSRLLFTLGPPTKGTLWESTAVLEIRVQAENLAKRLLAE